MKVKIASPMFILRDKAAKDLFAVLDKIKAIGYQGVEFLGFFDHPAQAVREKLDALQLPALGNHVDYQQFADRPAEIIATHQQIGCSYVTISGPPQDRLTDKDFLHAYIENVSRIGQDCRRAGLTLLYHNHAHELTRTIDGLPLLDYLLDHIPADCLALEPDLGWIAIGGRSPEFYLDKYQDRCPVIHLKDFYAQDPGRIGPVSGLDSKRGQAANSHFEFRPTGYGIANYPALLKKIQACRPDWLVADHDLAYERDPFSDLLLSLNYIQTLLSLHQPGT